MDRRVSPTAACDAARPGGRPRPAYLGDRRRAAPAGHRRPDPAGHPAAERAGADRRAGRQPDDRDPRVRRTCATTATSSPGRAPAASPAAGGRATAATCCSTRARADPDTIDLTCAAPIAPPGVAAAYEAAVGRAALPPRRERLLPLRPAGAARGDRAAVRRARAAHRPRPDPGHLRALSGAGDRRAVRFVDTGDRVLMESPTYPNAIATLRGGGARVLGADIDQSGWATVEPGRHRPPGPSAVGLPHAGLPQPDRAADGRRGARAAGGRAARGRAPCRSSTSRWRRLALDEAEMPLPFAAHAPARSSLGSASKAFWGGLRIGWVRAPQPRMAEAGRGPADPRPRRPGARAAGAGPPDGPTGGGAARVRARAARGLAGGAVAALAAQLPSWRFRLPAGGLSLWCELPRPVSSALAAAAEARACSSPPGRCSRPRAGWSASCGCRSPSPPATLDRGGRPARAAWERAPAASGRSGEPPRPAPPLVT